MSFEVKNVLDEGPNGNSAWYDSTFGLADPHLIKSADPVTYDSAGNVIPLSQRFNEQFEDIRYSLAPRSQVSAKTDAEYMAAVEAKDILGIKNAQSTGTTTRFDSSFVSVVGDVTEFNTDKMPSFDGYRTRCGFIRIR